MEVLSDYLRSDFLIELDAIHNLRDTADEALDTLEKFERAGVWPYEVEQGEELTFRPGYSFSTSAMILFAMAVASGVVGDSVLVPSMTERNADEMPQMVRDLHERCRRKLRSGLKRLLEESREFEADKLHAHALSSETFGPDDPFTLLWVLELLHPHRTDPEFKEAYDHFVRRAGDRVSAAFGEPIKPSKILNKQTALEHVFPFLRIVQVYAFLKHHGEAPTIVVGGALQYLKNRLHQHLSYFSVPDSSFDAAELSFTMEASVLLDRNALDEPLVDRCLEVLEQSQARNPYWRPLRPFIATEQGMVLLPLSVEIANSMLRISEALRDRYAGADCMPRYVNLFKRYTKWLFTRMVRGSVNQTTFVGWHSEHADSPGKIHLWETSQVLIYLVHYEAILRRYRAERSRSLSNLSVNRPDNQTMGVVHWEIKVGPKEPLRGRANKSPHAIYPQIGDKYIRPRLDPKPEVKPYYSLLLYGPQGTGKTTLAEDIAQTLAQPLIIVTPSDFTIGGEAAVEAQAKSIFEVLGAQSDCVVLFDEIDRLILDRDSEIYGKQGDIFQFMTPGMLTKIRDLRRNERVIFIISTNFAERIDPAIKRVGRIDESFLLLPPDSEQRGYIFLEQLDSLSLRVAVKSAGEFADILKETALMIPGEIQKIASTALRASVPACSENVVRAAQDLVRKTAPTIRLPSYRSRFKALNPHVGTAQEPHTEFLMLVYLLLESGRDFSAAEAQLLKDYGARVVSTPIEQHVADFIGDQEIAEILKQKLAEVRIE